MTYAKNAARRGRTWLWVLCACLALAACRHEPPEQRLRERLAQMQSAVEARRPDRFMEAVAEDFAGENGMDRAALQQMLRAQLLANARIGVVTGPAEIEVHEDGRATVRFSVVLTGSGGRWLPERAQAYEVVSGWREEGGAWRIYHAQWRPRL